MAGPTSSGGTPRPGECRLVHERGDGHRRCRPPGLTDTTYTIVGVGDFNDDGQPDILWRNTSTGAECRLVHERGDVHRGCQPSQLSRSTWKIVGTGDFNGDGRPDILWRNTTSGQNAVWYMNGVALTGVADLPGLSGPWTIVGR